MSRKKQAPKRIFYPESKYSSLVLAKFINFIMYDGKKTVAEKTIYSALNTQLFGWVIENIMRNAIDALQGKGEIKVTVKDQGKRVFVDISDTGKGIKSTQLKTVFEPGYTSKKRGWGLGLSLVKRIVEDYHKGQVFILHSELGKGTAFRISLLKS